MRLEISSFKQIVVLTGAGISAESGISTFRDSGGLWEKHRIEEVATPQAFRADPILVWSFYSERRKNAFAAKPNLAHETLARFASEAPSKGVTLTLVTQNVDGLHERAHFAADAAPPIAMHGTLSQSRCTECGRLFEDLNYWIDHNHQPVRSDQTRIHTAPPLRGASGLASIDSRSVVRDTNGIPYSPCCNKYLRPHIVWFGEMPLGMLEIERAIGGADAFAAIGTSGQVYPAAGFLGMAKAKGATTMCFNLEREDSLRPSTIDACSSQIMVDFYLEGPATETVPRIFKIQT